MAATLDFNKASSNILELKRADGKVYSLIPGARGALTVKQGNTVIKAPKELENIAKDFATAAEAASKSSIAEAKEIKLLRSVFTAYEGSHSAAVKSVRGVFQAAADIENVLRSIPANSEAPEAALMAIKKALVAYPEAQHILHANAFNRLTIETFKDAGGKAVRIVDFPKLEGEVTALRHTVDELVDLSKKGGYDEAALKKVLGKAPEGIKGFLPTEVVDEFKRGQSGVKGKANIGSLDLHHIAGEVEAEITAAKAEASRLGNRILTLRQKKDLFGRNEKALETLGKRLDDLVKANPDIHHHIQAGLIKDFDAEERAVISGVGSAKSAMGTLAKATPEAAKSGEGFWKNAINFKHTEATLKIPEARTAGKSAEEIAKLTEKLGKVRWGKAGLAAAGGLGLAYVVDKAFLATPANTTAENALRAREQQDMQLGGPARA